MDLEGNDVEVVQCTLAVRKTAEGKLELLLLGKTADPLVSVPLTSAEAQNSKEAVTLSAEVTGDGGTATIVLFGKYKASMSFTELG